MVEAGFTRAKNAGNIIMKNLMDFLYRNGSVHLSHWALELLLGEDALGGFIGTSGHWEFSPDYANFDWSNFVFNLVFCATAATIVSGAMAERTKFLILLYLLRSDLRSCLSDRGTLDLGRRLACTDEDSTILQVPAAIHTVGGTDSIYRSRTGRSRELVKFTRDKDGTVTKVHAFPGHNLVIGGT